MSLHTSTPPPCTPSTRYVPRQRKAKEGTDLPTLHPSPQNFLSVRSLPVPVVAAINGPAIGAGACVTLACDYRVARSDGVIGFNFCKLGIHPGMGGSHYLPRLIGPGRAAKVLLGGARMSGDEAKELGIVDELVPTDADFVERAVEIAGSMADNSPVAVRGMLRTLRQQVDVGLEESLRREADQQAINYARSDWREGLAAVMEKREPVFDPFFAK